MSQAGLRRELWTSGGRVNDLQLEATLLSGRLTALTSAHEASNAAHAEAEAKAASALSAACAALEAERGFAREAALDADARANSLVVDLNAARERARDLGSQAWTSNERAQALALANAGLEAQLRAALDSVNTAPADDALRAQGEALARKRDQLRAQLAESAAARDAALARATAAEARAIEARDAAAATVAVAAASEQAARLELAAAQFETLQRSADVERAREAAVSATAAAASAVREAGRDRDAANRAAATARNSAAQAAASARDAAASAAAATNEAHAALLARAETAEREAAAARARADDARAAAEAASARADAAAEANGALEAERTALATQLAGARAAQIELERALAAAAAARAAADASLAAARAERDGATRRADESAAAAASATSALDGARAAAAAADARALSALGACGALEREYRAAAAAATAAAASAAAVAERGEAAAAHGALVGALRDADGALDAAAASPPPPAAPHLVAAHAPRPQPRPQPQPRPAAVDKAAAKAAAGKAPAPSAERPPQPPQRAEPRATCADAAASPSLPPPPASFASPAIVAAPPAVGASAAAPPATAAAARTPSVAPRTRAPLTPRAAVPAVFQFTGFLLGAAGSGDMAASPLPPLARGAPSGADAASASVEELAATLSALGGRVVWAADGSSRLEESVTHVVREGGASSEPRRTSKTIYAALSGRALVTREWVGACVRAGALLPVAEGAEGAHGAVRGRPNPFVGCAQLRLSARFERAQPREAKLLRTMAKLAQTKVGAWAEGDDAAAASPAAHVGPADKSSPADKASPVGKASPASWLFVAEGELAAAQAAAGTRGERVHTWQSFLASEVPGHAPAQPPQPAPAARPTQPPASGAQFQIHEDACADEVRPTQPLPSAPTPADTQAAVRAATKRSLAAADGNSKQPKRPRASRSRKGTDGGPASPPAAAGEGEAQAACTAGADTGALEQRGSQPAAPRVAKGEQRCKPQTAEAARVAKRERAAGSERA